MFQNSLTNPASPSAMLHQWDLTMKSPRKMQFTVSMRARGSGSAVNLAYEKTPEYQTKGVYMMNHAHTGRCLDFGSWDNYTPEPNPESSGCNNHPRCRKAPQTSEDKASRELSGIAYVNKICHGTSVQRFEFQSEMIVGALRLQLFAPPLRVPLVSLILYSCVAP